VSDYRGADKSLAWPGRKQAQKHVRDARDFNKTEKLFLFVCLFVEIHASYNLEKQRRAGQTTDDNKAQTHCMLDT